MERAPKRAHRPIAGAARKAFRKTLIPVPDFPPAGMRPRDEKSCISGLERLYVTPHES
jgi:hypothetical protein